jgi:hypothetical protein
MKRGWLSQDLNTTSDLTSEMTDSVHILNLLHCFSGESMSATWSQSTCLSCFKPSSGMQYEYLSRVLTRVFTYARWNPVSAISLSPFLVLLHTQFNAAIELSLIVSCTLSWLLIIPSDHISYLLIHDLIEEKYRGNSLVGLLRHWGHLYTNQMTNAYKRQAWKTDF